MNYMLKNSNWHRSESMNAFSTHVIFGYEVNRESVTMDHHLYMDLIILLYILSTMNYLLTNSNWHTSETMNAFSTHAIFGYEVNRASVTMDQHLYIALIILLYVLSTMNYLLTNSNWHRSESMNAFSTHAIFWYLVNRASVTRLWINICILLWLYYYMY